MAEELEYIGPLESSPSELTYVGPPNAQVAQDVKTVLGRPTFGFWDTLEAESARSRGEVGHGLDLLLNPPSYASALGLEGPSRMALGAMGMVGAPFVAGFRKLGSLTQDAAMGLGASPDVSAGLATAVELGSPFALPKAAPQISSAMSKVGGGRIRQPLGPLSPEQQRVVELSNEFGVSPTAGQVRQSPGLSQAEAIPTRFPVGIKRIAEKGAEQRQAIMAAAESVGETIAPEKITPIKAGEITIKLMQKEETALRAKADELYGVIKTIVPAEEATTAMQTTKAVVELGRQAKVAQGVVGGRAERIAGKIAGPDAAETSIGGVKLSELPQDMATQIVAKYGLDQPQRQYTFEGLDLIRREVRSVRRQAWDSNNDNLARKLTSIEDGLTKDMEDVAGRYTGGAEALRDADAFYSSSVAPLFTKGKFPRQLSDKDASQVVKAFIWGNKDHPERIELVMKATGNREQANQVVRAWWDDLITRSFDKRTGLFSANRFQTQYKAFSPEARQALLGPTAEKADRLSELVNYLDRSTVFGANPSGTSQGILAFAQGGAFVNLALEIPSAMTGNLSLARIGTTGAITMGPPALARLLTSPAGIDWLTIGLQSAPGSPQRLQATMKVMAFANTLQRADIAKLMRNREVPVEEKVQAAMEQSTIRQITRDDLMAP